MNYYAQSVLISIHKLTNPPQQGTIARFFQGLGMWYWLWMVLEWLCAWWANCFISRVVYDYRRKKAIVVPVSQFARNPAKPTWVKKEIIRLKAFMPDLGCRKIADQFNLMYENHRKFPMTVGKTFVGMTIKQHLQEIEMLRKKFKHRIPKPLPNNIIWATDLTFVTDEQKQQNAVLGILDHGSRACLNLTHIKDKSSITLLRVLLNCIELYGKPKYLRTDNEPVFTSRLFRLGLWLLNIKHQRIPKHSPWKNGRIERFFWTFKNRIKKVVIKNTEHLTQALPEFRFWYNHARTHQHLKGKTPAQVWSKSSSTKPKQIYYFHAWDDVLTGLYQVPD